MMHLLDTLPAVLVFSGHDPCGGAGLMADVEALQAQDCHALTIATAQTVQNTQQATKFVASDADLLREQFTALHEDIPIAACKIGMLGSVEVANAVADCLQHLSDVPVILDPVMAADSGGKLAEQGLLECIKTRLLPMTTLLTPNIPELQALTGIALDTTTSDATILDTTAAIAALHDMGCDAVLLTGTHADTPDVVNTLFINDEVISSNWPRLPNDYHGSGCTLASAVAGRLAHQKSLTDQEPSANKEPSANQKAIEKAVEQALRFTWQSLDAAYKIGKGQWIPRRS